MLGPSFRGVVYTAFVLRSGEAFVMGEALGLGSDDAFVLRNGEAFALRGDEAFVLRNGEAFDLMRDEAIVLSGGDAFVLRPSC